MGVILVDGAVPKGVANELGKQLDKTVIKLPVSFVELASAIDLLEEYDLDPETINSLSERLAGELRKYMSEPVMRAVTEVAHVDVFYDADGAEAIEAIIMVEKIMLPLLDRYQERRQGGVTGQHIWHIEAEFWK